jgi:hypothetical protein
MEFYYLLMLQKHFGEICRFLNQLRRFVLLFTEHLRLKGHVFKLLLTNRPICKGCIGKEDPATHILCVSEAVAYLRFRHMGHWFMEPGDFHDAPIRKVLHFIRRVGLTEG